MLFKATERERDARKPKRHRHGVCAKHRILRHQPAIDTEVDAEQVKHSDGGHREADRDCEARGSAWLHEREAEGHEAHGRHRFHGGEARAPARKHRQPCPPADERRHGNRYRGKASSLTRALPSQTACMVDKQRHVGSRKSKPAAGRRSRTNGRACPATFLNVSSCANGALSL